MTTGELKTGDIKTGEVPVAAAGAGEHDVMRDPRTPEILDIVARETGVVRALLLPDARIEALGIASLDMVQTIFAIETRYDVEIPVVLDRVGAEFDTVGGLLAHVLHTLDRAVPERR